MVIRTHLVLFQESAWKAFSAFGPLYLLKVCPNAAVAEPGFYALIKYFSAAQASLAQRAMEGRSLFQTMPLRVSTHTQAHRHTHRHTDTHTGTHTQAHTQTHTHTEDRKSVV